MLSALWNVTDHKVKIVSAFSDKRKHIERRINMISKNGSMKNKKRIRMFAIVITLTFLLTGVFAAYASPGEAVIVDGEPGDITKDSDDISYNIVAKGDKKEVPQKMMPGSVIIYDNQLQPKVIKGGYIENETQPNVETEDSIRDSILKGLKLVPITDDMTVAEKELAEWENRLVSGLKEQIISETLVKTPFQPTIYPGMKVVYDEITGDINNIYYPDSDDPSGYSIHNIPTGSNQLITRTDTIDVMFNTINIKINGEAQDIDNFLYEGTTYVPLRAISEIFEKEVTWDGETKTASIKDIEAGEDEEDKVEIILLTQDELAYFNGDSFFNGDYLNIRNQFLSSSYSQPVDIDLFELFYCGSGIAEKITDDELKAVMEKSGMAGSIENLPCPCEKNSRSNMDKILLEHMGITLADTNEVGLDKFTYLPKYNAYYHLHGDTNYRTNIKFFKGDREGNLIRLFYNDTFFGDGVKVLTLQEKNGGYLFVSNQKVVTKVIDLGNSTSK